MEELMSAPNDPLLQCPTKTKRRRGGRKSGRKRGRRRRGRGKEEEEGERGGLGGRRTQE